MAAKYFTSRVLFAASGTLLLLFLLLGFGFTRVSSSSFRITSSKSSCTRYPALPFASEETLQAHEKVQHVFNETLDSSDPLRHASNATLGVSTLLQLPFLDGLHFTRSQPDSSQFQKIFVINLRSRYDHRDSMSLAAALSGLQIEYIDGVTDVDKKYLPPGGKSKPGSGSLGAWRAHMNVLRRIIEEDLTSALVLEDDTDWDVRIKYQMQDFARASRLLVQPLVNTTDRYLDPSYPRPSEGQKAQDFIVGEDVTSAPTGSPYGDLDRWDLLWLGHCGGRFPQPQDKNTPLGRAVILDDETVPEPQHIGIQMGNDALKNQYPPHTRVVHRTWGTVCTLAYGVSRAGARRFFYEMAVRKKDSSADLMFRRICDGLVERKQRTCLTVQPQLFNHHRPIANKETFSDITHHGDKMNEVAFTRNVRWSARVNFEKLVDGETDYIDLFKDGEEATKLGFG